LNGDSNKGTGKESGNSLDSDNQKRENEKRENDKPPKSDGSPIQGIISNIKKLTVADDLDPEKSEVKDKKFAPEKTESSYTPDKSKSSKKEASEKNDKIEDHEFQFSGIFGDKFISKLKTNKDKIIKGSAILVGGFLIIYGLILISASTQKVASNVIFGEDATLDAFLILVGVLIIVAAYSQSIMEKTSLNKINNELEVVEGRSKSHGRSKKVKDDNGNKVGKDNKDNIVGENKR